MELPILPGATALEKLRISTHISCADLALGISHSLVLIPTIADLGFLAVRATRVSALPIAVYGRRRGIIRIGIIWRRWRWRIIRIGIVRRRWRTVRTLYNFTAALIKLRMTAHVLRADPALGFLSSLILIKAVANLLLLAT